MPHCSRERMGSAVSMVSFFGSDAESVEKRDALGVHYLGLSLVLAWFYCLWFSPSVFVCTPLMGRAMVYSWLASLAFSALAFLVMPLALRRINIYEHPTLVWVSAGTLAAGTLLFTLAKPLATLSLFIWVVFPIVLAVANALLWAAWGEFYTRKRSTFAVGKFAFVYGSVMLVAMIMTEILPAPVSNVFVALLPIACGAVYKFENKTVEGLVFPTLLPKAIRKKTNRATLIISVSLCIACVACYFTIAIVPEDNILTDAAAYPLGMGLAAILCLVIASIARVGKRTEAAYNCDAVIVEFKLSKREGEILKLVARGYTVDNISNKLVISPYTTQTHIRHIYAKMNIHKRSELLDYINMHRDSEKPVRPAAKAEKK